MQFIRLSFLQSFHLLVLVIIFFPDVLLAQNLIVKVGSNVLVAKETDAKFFIEPHLAADPRNPNKLIAAAFLYDTAFQSGNVLAIFSSKDGGKKWERQNLLCIDCADPWVSITNRGLVFASALGGHPRLQKLESQLIVYSSTDSGYAWGETPQSLGAFHDRSRSFSAPDGSLYILSQQSVIDGDKKERQAIFVGRAEPRSTFINPMPLIFPSNMGLNSDGLATFSDGSLLITYDDGVRRLNGRFRGAGLIKGRRSWAALSKNRGQSFSMPMFLTEDCFRTPAFLAIDTSRGLFKDRLYYVCVGQNERGILLSYSADRGEEWTQVSIETPAEKDRSRLIPQVTVNNKGVVGVAWMDRRDDTSGKGYAPYFSASNDGGKTFSKPIRVSNAISYPKLDKMGGTGRRWPVGGDYFGLTSTSDGKFYIVWPDARNGFFELWATSISVATSN